MRHKYIYSFIGGFGKHIQSVHIIIENFCPIILMLDFFFFEAYEIEKFRLMSFQAFISTQNNFSLIPVQNPDI